MLPSIANLREHGSGVQVFKKGAARELQFLNGLDRPLFLLGLTRPR
jgi:hypothetical protein